MNRASDCGGEINTIKIHVSQPLGCPQSTIGGDINSIHHLEPKKGWSSLKDAFLKYYSLETGNKNNNKAATLPSDISSICCRCGQTRLMNDDKSYSRGGLGPRPRYSYGRSFRGTIYLCSNHWCMRMCSLVCTS